MINYTLSNSDKNQIKKSISAYMRKQEAIYSKNPTRFGNTSKDDLLKAWLKCAYSKATFELFVRDGLVSILKEVDTFYTFEDHAGDTFCPITNHNIDKKELKSQERRERARFNKYGCYIMTLKVLGDDIETIGGFVHNDFYGSGYDNDFYNTTFDLLRDNEITKEYISQIIDFLINLPVCE